MISSIISAITGGALSEIGKAVRSFITTDKDRMEFQLQIEKILGEKAKELEDSIQKEMEAKERILVAELTQGDTYTKRARPTIIYAGLAFIALVHVIYPTLIKLIFFFRSETLTPDQIESLESLLELSLPSEFWWAWMGVAGTWVIGRSLERRGVTSKAISLITGRK